MKGWLRCTAVTRSVLDACFLLNLDRRTDRLAHVQRQIKKSKLHNFLKPSVEVTRISGIDGSLLNIDELQRCGAVSSSGAQRFRLAQEEKLFGMDLTPGALGCAFTHRLAWEKVVEQGATAALILEDDVEFHHRFHRVFSERWKCVPSDWGVVYLGGLDLLAAGKPPRPYVAEGVRRAYQGHRELTAYIVNSASAEKLLELTTCLTWQIDTHICECLKEDTTAQDKYIADPLSYVLQPSLAIQVTSLGTDVQKHPSGNPSLEDASRRMREFIHGKSSVR